MRSTDCYMRHGKQHSVKQSTASLHCKATDSQRIGQMTIVENIGPLWWRLSEGRKFAMSSIIVIPRLEMERAEIV